MTDEVKHELVDRRDRPSPPLKSHSATTEIGQISSVFQRHHDYYRQIGGETLQQQLNTESAIRLQYAGRAPFELLQNALDRCDHTCIIAIVRTERGSLLVVGNDGAGISVDDNFDYDGFRTTGITTKRSDFHALCSIHTSNKAPDDSIGNKGVGFRAVFSLGDYTQVWTRLGSSQGWWGIELHRLLDKRRLASRRKDPRVIAGEARFLASPFALTDNAPRPSFYFPIPLWSHDTPLPLSDRAAQVTALNTLVVVPIGPEALPGIESAIGELRDAHLQFVGVRPGRRGITISILNERTHDARYTWFHAPDSDPLRIVATWHARRNADGTPHRIACMAKAAEHAITEPSVAVGWPADSAELPRGLYFCYLPTRVPQPFGIDVHADFQLGIDRTTLKCAPGEPVGEYNRALLEAAAEVHLHVWMRAAGFESASLSAFIRWKWVKVGEIATEGAGLDRRDDLFRMLCPGAAADPFVETVEAQLFDCSQWYGSAARYARWSALAARFFDTEVPLPHTAYDEFWKATAAWVDRACGYRSHTRTWGGAMKAMGDALRASGARVVPILDKSIDPKDRVQRAVPLPDYIEQSSGGRARRRLFLRAITDEQVRSELHLPTGLLDRQRAITTYAFPSGVGANDGRVLGAAPFERWDLLRELRQLPVRLASGGHEAQDLTEAVVRQNELLQFAAELYVAHFGVRASPQDDAARYIPGWRAHRESGPYSEDQLRAGRALATLFLPTGDGTWEPARQLDRTRVSVVWKAQISAAVLQLNIDLFLQFLGVSPNALLVLEGGEDGRVPALFTPPPLVDAEPGAPMALKTMWIDRDPYVSLERMREAWPWLEQLLHAEASEQLYGALVEDLSSQQWFPAAECATPAGLIGAWTTVAPRQIVLVGDTPDRRSAVLWTLRGVSRDAGILRQVGAIPSLRDDDLCNAEASCARRLWEHLTTLDLAAISCEQRARQALIELFQTLLLAVARAGSPSAPVLPLLAYMPADAELPFSERQLAWHMPMDDAWIAPDNAARDTVRAHFPRVPLVVATIGPQLVQRIGWLAARALTVTESARHTPFMGPEAAQFSACIRQDLGELLPGLLALAEVSRRLPESVHAADAEEKWHGTSIEQAENVWLDIELSLPGRPKEAAKWLFATREDVLLDHDVIRFDVRSGHERPPPLVMFADALAEAILGNAAVAGVWGQALAAFEDGKRNGQGLQAYRDYIGKRGAERLEQAFARLLQPLSDDARLVLWDKTDRALAAIESGLCVGDLEIDVLRELRPPMLRTPPGGWQLLTDRDLTSLLDEVAWSPEERAFRPRVVCRAYHAPHWEAWISCEQRLDRIVRLVGELEAKECGGSVVTLQEPSKMLSDAADKALARIAFEPARFVREWLIERAPKAAHNLLPTDDETSLLAALPAVPAPFKQVRRLDEAGKAGLQALSLTLRGPVVAELGALSHETLTEESITRAESGRDAEDAIAQWIVGSTRSVLEQHGDAAWSCLFDALRPTAKLAREHLERARQEPQTLGEALHVAAYWGSAGYDFLGLEQDSSGSPLAVRYECKAVRHATGPLRVYVSANELAVFRRTRRGLSNNGLPGTWKLVAVQPDERALDLTIFLDPLLDDGGPLAQMATMGFTADALVLSVSRSKS